MAAQRSLFGFIFVSMLAGCITPVSGPPSAPASRSLTGVAPAAPRAGDTAVYVVRNVYNGEPRGEAQYRVDKIEADRAIVGVTTTSPYAGLPHTEIDAPYGNWLRHPLMSHNQQVDYDFSPPFPAYPYPLDIGKSWSLRVNGVNPQTNRRSSVRVDGRVLGYERITVPAGTFDVVAIRRDVYPGDFDAFLQETHIVETDWYSPELGRSVRLETNSSWIDSSRGGGGGFMLNSNQLVRGDWNVYELVSYDVNGKRASAAVVPPPAPAR